MLLLYLYILYNSIGIALTGNSQSHNQLNYKRGVSSIIATVEYSDLELVWAEYFSYRTNEDLFQIWIPEHNPAPHTLSSRWKENIKIVDGNLFFLNKKEFRGGQTWTTGSMHTKQTFLYGYFECRYKYAKSKGTNNSFWLMNRTDTIFKEKKFEIDINEGRFPNKVNTNIHNWSDIYVTKNNKKSHLQQKETMTLEGENLSKEFHTYGLKWTEDEIIFYMDGKEIRKERNYFCHSPSPIYLSSAIIDWDGNINVDKLDGTYMEIDYVKVYRIKSNSIR